jgi:hypothetical protein
MISTLSPNDKNGSMEWPYTMHCLVLFSKKNAFIASEKTGVMVIKTLLSMIFPETIFKL